MRASAVGIGLFIMMFGFLLWVGIGYPIEIFLLIGFINIIFGFVTPKSPGLFFQSEPSSPVKLIVDKARSKTGTYQLVFADNRLIMKKLASTTGVVAVAFLFAVIGGMVGALTGYSLQEYLVEHRRNKIQKENALMAVTNGDVEISYDNMSQVELSGTKLKISSPNGPATIVMHKKYPPMIMAKLREIIPSQRWASQSSFSA